MNENGQLRYQSLSLIYLQLFTVEHFDPTRLDRDHFERIPDSIDHQIFDIGPGQVNPVERYRLKPLRFTLPLKDTSIVISGHMQVEMSVFFQRTVSLTYRMVIDGKLCKSTGLLSTDDIISLAALRLGAEHWNCDCKTRGGKRPTASNINLEVSEIKVKNFHLGQQGEPLKKSESLPAEGCFAEIQRRYRACIERTQTAQATAIQYGELNYVYVDVWEDIQHREGEFKRMTEPQIISHIMTRHKKELIGLLSFYPFEWPYRTEESFAEVCGDNIAIDTDDLILVNQNIAVVFGTYGLRGSNSPTDWANHLKERKKYHVSWPEYLMILEMVLAKKYTIHTSSNHFLRKTLSLTTLKNTRKMIEENAAENLKITTLMFELDAVNYSRYISHKIMFERTTERLEVDVEERQLNDMLTRIDKSLFSISEMRKLRQANTLNVILACLSIASLFAILFQSLHIPFLKVFGLGDQTIESVGFVMIILTAIIVVLGISMIFYILKDDKIPHRK